MNGLLISATARVLNAALAQISRPAAWPDPASGFAYRLFVAAGLSLPPAFNEPLRAANAQLLRRAPDLAAFGYVVATADPQTQVDWAQAFDRLMGRDVFPSDRNSFIHSPLELLGVAFGAAECPETTDTQRDWLASTIQRGIMERQFIEPAAQAAAVCAERVVSPARAGSGWDHKVWLAADLGTSDLCFLTALAILFPGSSAIDLSKAEQEIVQRVLSASAPSHDVAEAAAIYLVLKRAVDRVAVNPGLDGDPARAGAKGNRQRVDH